MNDPILSDPDTEEFAKRLQADSVEVRSTGVETLGKAYVADALETAATTITSLLMQIENLHNIIQHEE